MVTIDKKLKVLELFAKRLNEADINWAIGASLLLYFKNIVEDFNDIDVVLEVDGVIKLQEIFEELGAEALPISDNGGFKTTCFLKYVLDGVLIDVMAGFKVVDESGTHDCSFKASDVSECYMLNGIKIPLDKLNNWERYYSLLKRPNKVKLIQDYLKK